MSHFSFCYDNLLYENLRHLRACLCSDALLRPLATLVQALVTYFGRRANAVVRAVCGRTSNDHSACLRHCKQRKIASNFYR